MSVITSPSFPVILWLEDDPQLIDIFREDFEQSFELKIINSFAEFKQVSVFDLQQFAAFLVDMELSDGCQGMNTIDLLKQSGSASPILVLSNDESIKTRLEALKLGIEDYMWKAMPPEEIKLRINNSIQRNLSKKNDQEKSLLGLTIQPLRLNAIIDEIEIDLTKIEFQFLYLLIRNHPQPIELEFLKMEVWRIPHVEIGTINTFIWKLNKKLSCWRMRISKDLDKVFLITKDDYERN